MPIETIVTPKAIDSSPGRLFSSALDNFVVVSDEGGHHKEKNQMKIKTVSIVLMSLIPALGSMSAIAQAQQTSGAENSSPTCPPNTIPWNGLCLGVKAIPSEKAMPSEKAIPSEKGIPPETASNIDQNTCSASCNDVTCELICRVTMSKQSFEALTKSH